MTDDPLVPPADTPIRSVLGDLPANALGPTNYHEHLFQVTPLLPGDELDDEQASSAEAGFLYASGCRAMVDATPIGLGRRPAATARISEQTGLQVVHVTGFHRQAHYPGQDELLAATEDELAGQIRADLFDGMDGTAIRAGVVKAGIGLWSITAFERRVLTAAAGLAAQFGVPVMVHTESGSAAHDVLDLLAADGCPPSRVVLAHIDRNPDPGLHTELTARGAYLGYDGAARHQRWPDSMLIDCLAQVVEKGGGDRLLLGGDVARRSRYLGYGGMPGLSYLFDRFLPRVRDRIGAAATEQLISTNPATWLSWHLPTKGTR